MVFGVYTRFALRPGCEEGGATLVFSRGDLRGQLFRDSGVCRRVHPLREGVAPPGKASGGEGVGRIRTCALLCAHG